MLLQKLIKKADHYLVTNTLSRFILIRFFRRYNLLKKDDKIPKKVQQRKARLLARLKSKKEPINVLFFVHDVAKWQYESLYQAFELDPKFIPYVVVVPYTRWDNDTMFDLYDKTLLHFKSYRTLGTYDYKLKKFLNIKQLISADIIFFQDQYRNTLKQFQITLLSQTSLCCLVPYGYFLVNNYDAFLNKPFYFLIWKVFLETKVHKELADTYAGKRSDSFIWLGYSPMDKFLGLPSNREKQTQTMNNKGLKHIIWAPHHMIDDENWPASFLSLHQEFLELADTYKGKLLFTFKPHPVLKPKLYKHPLWGKEKTEAYYQQWEIKENTFLSESAYHDLFSQSDALIHDSISFIAEYLFTGKPVCYFCKSHKVLSIFNKAGEACLEGSYKAYSMNDVREFIEQVILQNNDSLFDRRKELVAETLSSTMQNTATDNIVSDIKSSIECILHKEKR